MSANTQDTVASQLLDFFHALEPLKHLERTGWLDRGVPRPESVAAHSWRLAMMSWIVADALGLNAERAVVLAMVHDVAEVITGDLTPYHAVSESAEERLAWARRSEAELPEAPAWKRRKTDDERAALSSLLARLPPALAAHLAETWEEYEQSATAEARLVTQLDKFEALVQGKEYLSRRLIQEPETLRSFYMQNRRMLKIALLRELLEALEAEDPRSGDLLSGPGTDSL